MPILCLILASLLIHSTAYPISLDNCPDTCGNTTIPYPFGTRLGCYLEKNFHIRCDTTSDPPKAFLGNIIVKDIMLSHSEMRIMTYVAHQCYNSDGTLNSSESNQRPSLTLGKFPLSQFRNKFTVVGCDVYAYFRGSRTSLTGCTVICGNLTDVSNGTCTGLGCCQIDIPRLAMTTNISLNSFRQHTLVSSFDPCSYAFVVEEHQYTFNSLDFRRLVDVESFPVILDWTIGSQTCVEAKKSHGSYACKANSDCFNSTNAPGYKCACKQGFEGNPYHPDGCHDMDECKVYNPGPCSDESKCVNLIGGYECHCPHGYEGNGKLNGTGPIGCRKKPTSPYIIALLVAGVSSACAAATAALLYCNYKLKLKVKLNLRSERYKKNGGPILETENSGKTLKHYTEKELKEATKNYQADMILVGRSGDKGTMYKGEFPDDKTVAIKKSDVVEESQAQHFIEEIVLLSMINHQNIVKLVGCCLETEVPTLVYEHVSNETLFDRIQRSNDSKSSMSWDTRLKIALGVAEALSYLHVDGHVVHGNVRSMSILLDESCTPKLSDFGAAKFASLGKASSTTFVEERSGYLDPEYLQTNTLTEESDVYSFGVVLVELITGTTVASFDITKEKGGLIMYFVSSVKNHQLSDVVDDNLKKSKVNGSQRDEVAKIASKCLEVKGEGRPKMQDVKIKLRELVGPNCLSANKKKEDPSASNVSLGGSINIDPNKTTSDAPDASEAPDAPETPPGISDGWTSFLT